MQCAPALARAAAQARPAVIHQSQSRHPDYYSYSVFDSDPTLTPLAQRHPICQALISTMHCGILIRLGSHQFTASDATIDKQTVYNNAFVGHTIQCLLSILLFFYEPNEKQI